MRGKQSGWEGENGRGRGENISMDFRSFEQMKHSRESRNTYDKTTVNISIEV